MSVKKTRLLLLLELHQVSVKLLASHGAKVVLGARRENRLQELVKTIE